jgi:molybdate transport system ATP-binding protein
MKKTQHFGIVVNNVLDKNRLIDTILKGELFSVLATKKGVVFSETAIEKIIEAEDKHDCVIASKTNNRKLQSYSSGERKKIFLGYCIKQKSDYIILDHLFEHLDLNTKTKIIALLELVSESKINIQIADKQADLLPFITKKYELNPTHFNLIPLSENLPTATFVFEKSKEKVTLISNQNLEQKQEKQILIAFNAVSLQYGEQKVLNNITWCIKKGDFWQLVGPNGSGKSTILSLINGDNPKAYGQDITLFGTKKGSGESIWDIKKQIGYFNPNMTELFNKNQTLEQMVVSGFYDSIGLYVKPTTHQLKTAEKWLLVAELDLYSKTSFSRLTVGQKRLALIIRAIIKTPQLLILDEPIAGLDDEAVAKITFFVNTLIQEQNTTIIYVSHQLERRLKPTAIFELIPDKMGSRGQVVKV